MGAHLNAWTFDTCACRIEVVFDDSLPPASRVNSYYRTLAACPAHTVLAGLSTHYDTVLDRNRRKNATFAEALTVLASLTSERFDGMWSYDAAVDVLTINGTAGGLTANQRNSLQNKCNTRFGVGKVVVV